MKEEEIRKREIFNKYLDLVRIDAETFFPDKSQFITYNCPACSCSSYRNEIIKNGFIYVQCNNCDTLFVNPRPQFNELMKFYSDSPSTNFWVNKFFMPVAEVRREKIFKPRAEYLSSRFPELADKAVGDIGAGFGIFLEEMKLLWPKSNLVAIEPSKEMAKICWGKGLNVIELSLEEIDTSKYSFNLLTAFELFEHLYNPKEFLEKVYSLLSPGGYFYMTTLNGLGFDIQVLWENSKSVSPPHHLNFFNPYSIKLLMESCGFKIIEISTPGLLDWNIVEGSYKAGESKPERIWRTISKHLGEDGKMAIQKWISDYLLSSHMRVIVSK